MGWQYLGILFAVCLVLTLVGFYKYVYFLSVGYGLAIAGSGITIFIMALANGWAKESLVILIIQTLLFVAYGVRLSGFLIYREFSNKAYRKVLKSATGDDKRLPIFVLVTMWIFCAALYVCQSSAMFFRYLNGSKEVVVTVIGMVLSVLGLLLESFADKQKSAQKKERPDMVATKGLYRFTRCPNYCGEILFWTGVFVSGIGSYKGAGQWIAAVVAYICIFYIMVNGAQRLEKRQNERYGENEEYKEYVKKTPILLPFLPVYHLNKTK